MERAQIVEAIRRTAADNDGVPLGRMRFERETGIKESDWSGRYWARWSEAVNEAGFEPQVMQEAYSIVDLVASLVEMIDALGKWPTNAERKLYARQHECVPSHNTFRRLGGTTEQAQAVLDLAEALGISDLAAAVCRDIASSANPEPSEEVGTTAGFVYLLKSGRYYKIGKSNDPSRRAYELRLQLPEPVKELHRIDTDDPSGIEAYWHRRFADRRKNGEWFALSHDDVRSFRSRKVM